MAAACILAPSSAGCIRQLLCHPIGGSKNFEKTSEPPPSGADGLRALALHHKPRIGGHLPCATNRGTVTIFPEWRGGRCDAYHTTSRCRSTPLRDDLAGLRGLEIVIAAMEDAQERGLPRRRCGGWRLRFDGYGDGAGLSLDDEGLGGIGVGADGLLVTLAGNDVGGFADLERVLAFGDVGEVELAFIGTDARLRHHAVVIRVVEFEFG